MKAEIVGTLSMLHHVTESTC